VFVLLICSSSLFITYLDSTILNVALPTLQVDLHASLAGLQWVADAYLLVVASLLMLTGSTADRLGRKRLFLIGLAGFGVGSLLTTRSGCGRWASSRGSSAWRPRAGRSSAASS
jgi:MFS family permease